MRLDDLIDKTLAIIKTRDYKESTWQSHFRNGRLSSIRQYFEERNANEFDVEIANEYIMTLKKRYENDEFSYSRFAHLKKLALWLIEVHETGELPRENGHKSKLIVNQYFESILFHHLGEMKKALSSGSIPRQNQQYYTLWTIFKRRRSTAISHLYR